MVVGDLDVVKDLGGLGQLLASEQGGTEIGIGGEPLKD